MERRHGWRKMGGRTTRRENDFLRGVGGNSVESTRESLVWVIPIPKKDSLCPGIFREIVFAALL